MRKDHVTIDMIEKEAVKKGLSLKECLEKGRGIGTPIYEISGIIYSDRNDTKVAVNTIYRKIERFLANSKNDCDAIPTNSKRDLVGVDFYCFEKSIYIARHLLIDITDNGEITFNEDYLHVINDAMKKNEFMCTIKSNSRRINKAGLPDTPKIVIYLICMHEVCKEFKLQIFDENLDPLKI